MEWEQAMQMENTKDANERSTIRLRHAPLGVRKVEALSLNDRHSIETARKILLSTLANKKGNPLYGDFEAADKALANMNRHNALPCHFIDRDNGMPYVVKSVAEGLIRITEAMHVHGLDMRASGPKGENIIGMDIKENRGVNIRRLLDWGGDPNAVQRGTPAVVDAEFYHEECGDSKTVVDILCRYGADINMPDHFNETALKVAVRHMNTMRISDLLRLGAVPTEDCVALALEVGMQETAGRLKALVH